MSTKRRDDRAWVEVDLAKVVENARTVQAVARCHALLPMIKANAYGLGAVEVARALERLDPWGFGVATIDEAVELRRAGVDRPLIVFTPALASHASIFREFDLRAVLDRVDVVRGWTGLYHLEVDTGMARCGVRWDDVRELVACETESLEGVFTHLHSADAGATSVELQWSRFENALGTFSRRPALVHAANSAGAWRLQHALDLVRPGIFLYGGQHAPDLPPPRPVVTVRSTIVSVRLVPAGETVSYGGTWTAARPTRVATIGIGYADGFPRTIGESGAVLVKGNRRQIVGRVTMDFIMVALEDGDAVSVGDPVIIIGKEGAGAILIDEFAGWAGTISYEILTRLGQRLPHEYHNNE